MEPQELNRIIRRPELRHVTGLTDSVLDRLVRDNLFPRPFKLTPDPRCRAVGWSMRAVQDWIAEREREGAQAAA